MLLRSEITATAPAATATIPAVLLRSCTWGRIGGSRAAAALRRSYWKVTGNDIVLFAMCFSPGTGSTVATTVSVPGLGAELSVT
jgi:hypothetical protein